MVFTQFLAKVWGSASPKMWIESSKVWLDFRPKNWWTAGPPFAVFCCSCDRGTTKVGSVTMERCRRGGNCSNPWRVWCKTQGIIHVCCFQTNGKGPKANPDEARRTCWFWLLLLPSAWASLGDMAGENRICSDCSSFFCLPQNWNMYGPHGKGYCFQFVKVSFAIYTGYPKGVDPGSWINVG